jgi:osmotically-inducible protein OsmY
MIRSGRLWPAVVLAAALALPGCTERQEAEANSAARDAGNKVEQLAERAKEGLKDGSVTTRVKSALVASGKLDASRIDVDTKGKTVTLKGVVKDQAQKATAERIANDIVDAETKVMSQLTVEPPARPASPAGPAGR